MKQITVISILLVLMIVFFPLIASRLKQYRKQLRIGKACVFGLYLLVNLYLTLFSRTVNPSSSMRLSPLWSYIDSFNGNAQLGIQIVLNILLYVPLGYLLCFLFTHISILQIIAVGVLISAATEAAQLIFKLGMFEWDDMISNTLGAVIGAYSFRGINKVFMNKPKESNK